MRKVRTLMIIAVLGAAPAVSAPNPRDIQFKISFAANKSFFNVGEPIEIEILYSTQVEKNIVEVGLRRGRGWSALFQSSGQQKEQLI
jgi:hypothetical protein